MILVIIKIAIIEKSFAEKCTLGQQVSGCACSFLCLSLVMFEFKKLTWKDIFLILKYVQKLIFNLYLSVDNFILRFYIVLLTLNLIWDPLFFFIWTIISFTRFRKFSHVISLNKHPVPLTFSFLSLTSIIQFLHCALTNPVCHLYFHAVHQFSNDVPLIYSSAKSISLQMTFNGFCSFNSLGLIHHQCILLNYSENTERQHKCVYIYICSGFRQ